MAINVKPLGDRVLVEAVEEKETKKGGIIIPDTAKEKPQEGIVRVLGTGKTGDDGKKIAFEVKVGSDSMIDLLANFLAALKLNHEGCHGMPSVWARCLFADLVDTVLQFVIRELVQIFEVDPMGGRIELILIQP